MDPDSETFKRFYSAILIQAFRDFCSGRAADQSSVSRWINTPGFREVCEGAEVEPEATRNRFIALAKLRPSIRKKLLSEISRGVLGFPKG